MFLCAPQNLARTLQQPIRSASADRID